MMRVTAATIGQSCRGCKRECCTLRREKLAGNPRQIRKLVMTPGQIYRLDEVLHLSKIRLSMS
jgi:predicted transcriptional regulator